MINDDDDNNTQNGCCMLHIVNTQMAADAMHSSSPLCLYAMKPSCPSDQCPVPIPVPDPDPEPSSPRITRAQGLGGRGPPIWMKKCNSKKWKKCVSGDSSPTT